MHLIPTTNLSSVWSKSCWRCLSSYLWFLLSTLCSIFWPSWPQRHHRTLSSPLQNPDNTVPAVFLESIHLVALSKTEMRLTWQEMRSVWQLVVKHWTMWELIVWVNNVRHDSSAIERSNRLQAMQGNLEREKIPENWWWMVFSVPWGGECVVEHFWVLSTWDKDLSGCWGGMASVKIEKHHLLSVPYPVLSICYLYFCF